MCVLSNRKIRLRSVMLKVICRSIQLNLALIFKWFCTSFSLLHILFCQNRSFLDITTNYSLSNPKLYVLQNSWAILILYVHDFCGHKNKAKKHAIFKQCLLVQNTKIRKSMKRKDATTFNKFLNLYFIYTTPCKTLK